MKTSLVLNNDWQQTFNRLKVFFKTNAHGASIEDAKSGLDRFFNDIGVEDAITHYYDCNEDKADWDEVKRRIDFGEPFIYGITDHYYYTRREVCRLSLDFNRLSQNLFFVKIYAIMYGR